MKTIKQLTLLLIIAFAFASCEDKVTNEVIYKANVPIYMDEAEFNAAVKKTTPQEVQQPGKIYIKDQYLFVNEVNKGIHVFDNSNPESPVAKVFINIPGNVDMAIKGNHLYADSYIDLVVVDISDILNPREVDRYEDAFPDIFPEVEWEYPVADIDKNKGVVIGWEVKDITVEQGDENRYYYTWGGMEMDVAFANSAPRGGGGSSVGIAGSMARFAIKDEILYAINNNFEIKIFDIQDNIEKVDSIQTLWGIETLFIYENKMFIGSNNGMYIYDINDADHPVFISDYMHVTSCDPVVVSGDYAFVTLRTGNNCFGNVNELQIVSIEDIQNPVLKKQYPMFNPHGLGIDDNTLFICDGSAGLKVYDATDVMAIDQNQLAHFEHILSFDVIPYNDVLIMSGTGGIYQYDYSDVQNIRKISEISIND